MLKSFDKSPLTLLLVFIAVTASTPALLDSGRDVAVLANIHRVFGSFFPMDFSILPDLGKALIETLQISVIATLISAVVSLPISLMSSRHVSPLAIRVFTLGCIALIRSVPSLIWALIAVSVVGPYPVAGVIALVFYSVGYLGKFFADSLDLQNFKVFHYYRRQGASRLVAFYFGIWFSFWQKIKKHVLWMFEYNIRSASIIGYVGAGGIGVHLHTYQEYGRWDRFSVVILLIFLISGLFEFLSNARKKS